MNENKDLNENLRAALALGDPEQVAALIRAGADVHYQTEGGYDALLDAVHNRDILRDPRLMELLTLLIENGVSLTGKNDYGETGVRVLSHRGRFDAVQLLLNAGANPADVELTALMEAVAFGSLADVERILAQGADLEARDYWERTAWLFAIQTGDVAKAKFLYEQGADADARGRCGKPPLFYAIENGHAPMLRWLLESGQDIRQADEFGTTPLVTAAESDNAEAVDILLEAGADVNEVVRHGSALSRAATREIILRLLQAGADPQEISGEGRRAMLGYPPDSDEDLLNVSVDDFRRFRKRRFGRKNPEPMNNPFWEGMIRSGVNAYRAIVHVEGERAYGMRSGPTWCAQRFGQSLTFLDDGRIVQVAGEHEDSYDSDFCIYNDVFVHDPDGHITLYGYPESVFPPTDFHTATLIGDHLYLIGSLGYWGARRFGETPVYRLDTQTFKIKRLQTTGDNPGWIYKHRAIQSSPHEIQITGGKIATDAGGAETHADNAAVFTLNIETLVWETHGPGGRRLMRAPA